MHHFVVAYLDTHPPSYIVYSKEDDPANRVLYLADLLRYLGHNCDIDQYYDYTRNWGQWNEQKIKGVAQKKGFILLICGRTLHCCYNSMGSLGIKMKSGYINNQVLISLVEDQSIYPQVIPVFLECCEEQYIPTCLLNKRSYCLNMSKVMEVFTPEVLEEIERRKDTISTSQILKELLSTPGLEDFHTLLRILHNKPPVKPNKLNSSAKSNGK